MECEYLKRWFGSLTEQNRQLQKEVEELRAMKVGPAHSCDPPLPASALSMCPRCERVTATTDKGPTSWAAATATTTTKPATMSSKVPPMMRHSRHPSAACWVGWIITWLALAMTQVKKEILSPSLNIYSDWKFSPLKTCISFCSKNPEGSFFEQKECIYLKI